LLEMVKCVRNVCSFHFACVTIVTHVSVFPIYAT
jgi:hypothetical protein